MATKPTDAETAASAALALVYHWLKRLAAVGGGLGGDAEVNALRVAEAQEVIRLGLNDRDLVERQACALAACAEMRAALERHVCQHVECNPVETHAGCHARAVLRGKV